MSATSDQSSRVVPAQLGFLAIYNPSLGTTDETLENQIVYYSSIESPDRGGHQYNPQTPKAIHDARREENNERLRQIGLAQGMVEFGKSFSDGKSVDTVETEKSRIVLHELEPGWWILASVNLTILPSTTKTLATKGKATEQEKKLEYSSREVKPSTLLLGDLLQAHSTFLLHHASSLSALFVFTRRSKFISMLERYWDTFISSWNVLMQGNPASSLYRGIKIAACGELGVGVGEEERGSGEREVLEGFVDRIDGLVDVIVSKFGDAESNDSNKVNKRDEHQPKPTEPWLGSGNEPAAEDGTIFLGNGALSRKSLRDVSQWVEDLYRWGPCAYGIIDNPSSIRRTKHFQKYQQAKKKEPPFDIMKGSREVHGLSLGGKASRRRNSLREDTLTTIPPTPVVDGDAANDRTKSKQNSPSLHHEPSTFTSATSTDSESNKGNKLVQLMKLGYGTHWSLDGSTSPADDDGKSGAQGRKPNSGDHSGSVLLPSTLPNSDNPFDTPDYPEDDSVGHYLIGLMGNIESEDGEDKDNDLEGSMKYNSGTDGNSRLLLRTLILELEREEDTCAEADININLGNNRGPSNPFKQNDSEHTGTSDTSSEKQNQSRTKKLRVVVYVKKPFIFVFLFELRTYALELSSFYRSLHYQIGPLIKPLMASTTFRASKPAITSTEDVSAPIYDLVWDPKRLTVYSTIPNIPDPFQAPSNTKQPSPWSRIEALNTHMQIVNTYITTTTDRSELERTSKTSRGWWVVWTRIPESEPPIDALFFGACRIPGSVAENSVESTSAGSGEIGKRSSPGMNTLGTSILSASPNSGPAHPLIEAAYGYGSASKDKEIFLIRRASDYVASRSTSRFTSGFSAATSDSSWNTGPGKLVQGIGVDTKRYIEALLNLNM